MHLRAQAILLAAILQAVLAAPARESTAPDIVKTVVLPNGQTIDWVRASSQGEIAAPPPAPKLSSRSPASSSQLSDLIIPIPAELYGPDGTVPVVRNDGHAWPEKLLPPSNTPALHGERLGLSLAPQNAAGQHWYAAASVSVKSTGAGAAFSMYKPYLESRDDFSLLQLALIRQQADNANYGTVVQTLEAGWMHYPPKASNPQLFTFYNVNGYRELGDEEGGWNRDYKGWVQVDRDIYPGIEFRDFSVIGGKQLEMDLRYHLHDGNWWLRAFGKDIGYYPASLFSKGVDSGKTMASFADRIDFYGEVYNSGDAITTTDMGSGEFADKGDKKSAYIRNMVYFDASGKSKDYSAGTMESDHERYRIEAHWGSSSSWNSYCYVGGPGAGGVVGG
ncbi:hypothetical protein K4F52_007166 [Lecanicillium sp. MT-2017a]|nr:hypothetical protein K4F52_007166 [Lecanicillium sp. MT-2017a]